MTDTIGNNGRSPEPLTGKGWPVAAEIVGMEPNGGGPGPTSRQPPPPPPPPPPADGGPPQGPLGAIPRVAPPERDRPPVPSAPAPSLVEQMAAEEQRADVDPGTYAALLDQAHGLAPGTTARMIAATQPPALEAAPQPAAAREPAAMPAPTPRAHVQYEVGAPWPVGPPEAGSEVTPPVAQPQPDGAGRGPVDPEPATPDPGRGGDGGGRKRLELPSWLAKGRKRNRVLMVVGAVLLLMIVANTCAGRAGSILQSAVERGSAAGGKEAAAQSGHQTVTNYVVVPTDWFACPPTDLAMTAIGFDNGGTTLNAARATEVAADVRHLEALGVALPSMWIVTHHNPEVIKITPGPDPDGTPLFKCADAGNGPPSTALVPTSPTSAPGH